MSIHVTCKCAISLDGYIDDSSDERVILSNPKDVDRVDAIRSDHDAILVGANTIRRDNPRLLIKSEERSRLRTASGKQPHPIKVTITRSGKLNRNANFFQLGGVKRIVFCPKDKKSQLEKELLTYAEIIPYSDATISIQFLLSALEAKGVKKLLVEGGGEVLTEFLNSGFVNELRVSVAPFFVGDPQGTKMITPIGSLLHSKENRMHLESVEKLDDMAILIYRLRK